MQTNNFVDKKRHVPLESLLIPDFSRIFRSEITLAIERGLIVRVTRTDEISVEFLQLNNINKRRFEATPTTFQSKHAKFGEVPRASVFFRSVAPERKWSDQYRNARNWMARRWRDFQLWDWTFSTRGPVRRSKWKDINFSPSRPRCFQTRMNYFFKPGWNNLLTFISKDLSNAISRVPIHHASLSDVAIRKKYVEGLKSMPFLYG